MTAQSRVPRDATWHLLRPKGHTTVPPCGSGICNQAKPPEHAFVRLKFQPRLDGEGCLSPPWLRPQAFCWYSGGGGGAHTFASLKSKFRKEEDELQMLKIICGGSSNEKKGLSARPGSEAVFPSLSPFEGCNHPVIDIPNAVCNFLRPGEAAASSLYSTA